MADLMQQARDTEAALRAEVKEQRDPLQPLFMNSIGRLMNDAANVIAALRVAPECAWTLDDSSGAWESACGETWQFNDGGPADNNCRFCHGCGGQIAARPQGVR